MSDIQQNPSALICSFRNDKTLYPLPTREDMVQWLYEASGLSAEYLDKITNIKYLITKDTKTADGGSLEVSFDETANCFIAMRDIKKRAVNGRYGVCEIQVACRRGVFSVLRLVPAASAAVDKAADVLLSPDDVAAAMKPYGEIVSIQYVRWNEVDCYHKDVLTGDVDVYLLTDPSKDFCKSTETIKIAGIDVSVINLTYMPHHDDRTMQELWDAREDDNDNRTKKILYRPDEEVGCRVVCKFPGTGNYLPDQRDVFLWLVRKSGLRSKNVLAFKVISETEYHIVFNKTVNCFLAMQEMQNLKVYHAHSVWSEIRISSPKGDFMEVAVKPRTNKKFTSLKDVKESLTEYGKILECRISHRYVDADEDGTLVCDYKCRMFVTKELPSNITDDRVDMDIFWSDADIQTFDEDQLTSLWGELNL